MTVVGSVERVAMEMEVNEQALVAEVGSSEKVWLVCPKTWRCQTA
jgi:hypothetical protein